LLLDVPSRIVGVSGGMISSLSVLANGEGEMDDACGQCAFFGAWGDAALEDGRTVPIRLRQTPTTYRVAAHILFTAAISQIRSFRKY
jgi:hypothetical protein